MAERRTRARRGKIDKKQLGKIRVWTQLLLFPATLLYNEFWLRVFGPSGVFRHFFLYFFFAISVGLFYYVLTSLFSRKVNRILTMVVLAVHTVYFSTECLLENAYQLYWSPRSIFSGANNVAGEYTTELLKAFFFGIPKILIFAIPLILYIKIGKKYVSTMRQERFFSLFVVVAAILVFAITSLFAGHGKTKAAYRTQFEFDTATKTFGLVDATRLSLKYDLFGRGRTTFADESANEETEGEDVSENGISPTPTPAVSAAPVKATNEMDIDFTPAEAAGGDVAELTSYIQSLEPSNTNAYTGIFEGKNLILVCAESFYGGFMTPELTPTLWRMAHNGFYFSDFYQPAWGGSTTTGEVSFALGMAGSDGDDSMYVTRNNNNYFTMGNQLQRQGYSSIAFHNGYIKYYNRHLTHENLGYNAFIANENGIEDICGWKYPEDPLCIEKTLDLYIDKSPFSVYYMTLTGHAPYDTEDSYVQKWYDRVDAAVGDQYKETTKYYICSQMELEESMRIMVEKLEQAGIADDTVIAIVGDHYPYGLGASQAWGNSENYLLDLYKTDMDHPWLQDENNLIIWSGSLENEHKAFATEVSAPTFSLDILPTLSNLFGVEYDSRMLPGRDVFSDAEPIVFWRSLSWVTERGKYDGNEDEFYPNEGEEVDDAYIERIHRIVQNKLALCRTVLHEDYYGVLFGPDDVTFAGEEIYHPLDVELSDDKWEEGDGEE